LVLSHDVRRCAPRPFCLRLALDVAEEADRYGLYTALVVAESSAGDSPAAKRYAEQCLRYIESLPLAANRDLREARDRARLTAAQELDDLARVVSALESGEQALPASYAASLA
jgi:hypothetical protein